LAFIHADLVAIRKESDLCTLFGSGYAGLGASMDSNIDLRKHLVALLRAGGAHISFEKAVSRFPTDLRGKKPRGAQHSAWSLLEHMRIAQWDILQFSVDAAHVSPDFPGGYWPKSRTPPSTRAWNESIKAFHKDLEAMIALVENPSTDLFARIPHGTGQTVLREALLIADHNAYHLGQFVLLRRLLGAWPNGGQFSI